MTPRAYLRSFRSRGALLTVGAILIAAVFVLLTGDRRALLLSLVDDVAIVGVISARRVARLMGGLR